MSNDNIIIEAPNDTTLTIKGGNLVSIKAKNEICDEKILVEIFNNHCINIVEKSSGSVPKSLGNPSNPDHDKFTIQNITECYKNHPSIIKIKENFKNFASFGFTKHTIEYISLIKKSLTPAKAISPDCIPLKVITFASNVVDSHLCNIILKDLEKKQVLRKSRNSISKTHFLEK